MESTGKSSQTYAHDGWGIFPKTIMTDRSETSASHRIPKSNNSIISLSRSDKICCSNTRGTKLWKKTKCGIFSLNCVAVVLPPTGEIPVESFPVSHLKVNGDMDGLIRGKKKCHTATPRRPRLSPGSDKQPKSGR